jgi:benzil reductase ((S)-benzoin forming)
LTTVYITGVSKGLGLALAEKFLAEGDMVVGIGRSTPVQHPNFSFITCDLSKHKEVADLHLVLPSLGKVILINNAGVLGTIKRISEQDQDESAQIFQVNTLAPIQLCRKFAKQANQSHDLTIVNISSGAGRKAIPSWATYCASKAALDLFSETFQLEEKELGKNTRIFSLAPGVIDTSMQSHIRASKEQDFSSFNQFKKLKEQEELKSTSFVANELVDFLRNRTVSETICRL